MNSPISAQDLQSLTPEDLAQLEVQDNPRCVCVRVRACVCLRVLVFVGGWVVICVIYVCLRVRPSLCG